MYAACTKSRKIQTASSNETFVEPEKAEIDEIAPEESLKNSKKREKEAKRSLKSIHGKRSLAIHIIAPGIHKIAKNLLR